MVRTIKTDRVADFLRWQKYLVCDEAALQAVPRPERLGGKRVPETFNDLTLGDLAELWSIRDQTDLLFRAPKVVLGLTEKQVLRSRTTDLIGFLNFTGAELKRIADMWEQCSNPPTPEQMEAGVRDLDFGAFGIIDSWARRMHIPDHDQAAQTNWLVVWQCMKNDARTAAYERRLQAVINRKSMRKR